MKQFLQSLKNMSYLSTNAAFDMAATNVNINICF